MGKYTTENLVRDYAKGDIADADAALKRGSAVYKGITAGLSVRDIAAALSEHYGYKVSSSTIGNLSLAYSALVQTGFTTGRDANLAMRAIVKVQNISGGAPALKAFLAEHETTTWKTVGDLTDALTTLKDNVNASKPETVTRADRNNRDTEASDPANGSSSGVPVDDHTPTFTVKDVAANLSATEAGTLIRALARRDWTAAERQSIEKAVTSLSKAFAKADENALANA